MGSAVKSWAARRTRSHGCPPRVNARGQAGDRAGAAGPRPFCSEYFVLPLPACRRKPPRPADPASAVKHSRGWPLSFPSPATGSEGSRGGQPGGWRGTEQEKKEDAQTPTPGAAPGLRLAVDIFAANLLLAVLATRVMFEVGRRVGLMAGDIDAREARALRARAAAMVIVVAVSAGLAWVNPAAAKYCWVLIPIAVWTAEHRSARPASPSGPPDAAGQ